MATTASRRARRRTDLPALLSKDTGEPLYRQLATLIAKRIGSGDWSPGDRLPTEPELMAEHGISRITVRQAIALLVRSGMVVTRPGKGTFVATPKMSHDLGALRGFYDALREQGFEPQTELLEFSPSAGSADPARPEGLDLPVRLRRLYSLEGSPFAVVDAWLPAAAAAIGQARAARLTVYEILERFLGERVASADVAIRCERPSPSVGRLLGLPKGGYLLMMERRSQARGGRVLECLRAHIVPERYEFRLRVPGPLEIANSLRRAPSPAANRA